MKIEPRKNRSTTEKVHSILQPNNQGILSVPDKSRVLGQNPEKAGFLI